MSRNFKYDSAKSNVFMWSVHGWICPIATAARRASTLSSCIVMGVM